MMCCALCLWCQRGRDVLICSSYSSVASMTKGGDCWKYEFIWLSLMSNLVVLMDFRLNTFCVDVATWLCYFGVGFGNMQERFFDVSLVKWFGFLVLWFVDYRILLSLFSNRKGVYQTSLKSLQWPPNMLKFMMQFSGHDYVVHAIFFSVILLGCFYSTSELCWFMFDIFGNVVVWCVQLNPYLDHSFWFEYALENKLEYHYGSHHSVWIFTWNNLYWRMSFDQLFDKLYCLFTHYVLSWLWRMC